MKKVILMASAAIFVIFSSTNVCAVDCYQGYSVTCREWNPDVKDNCGVGCTYHYDSATKTLTVVADGDNAKIDRGVFMPYSYQTDTSKKTFPSEDGPIEVKNVVIDGNFKTIEAYAFLDLGVPISSKDGVIYAETIGRAVFANATITSDIVVDKIFLETVGGSSRLFDMAQFGEDVKIYCVEKDTEECRQYIMDSCDDTSCDNYVNALLSDDSLFAKTTKGCVRPTEDSKCSKCKNGYLEKEGKCIDSVLGCGENYKDMGGWCNRIRYTPAEAAKVLKNDNTNEIVITFKK